ncbi:hypothetical protein EVA_10467 [gut metagenome]|uniref:HNH nuclease domain-containing protein n=1 Tax=gut metagenome TaxID=749906 RepID=J9G2G7_9ZZZZ
MKYLGKIFGNTTATYKFFWFVSLLQIHAKQKDLRISLWDMAIRMVANAWYPIHYFRLSFGKTDSLFAIVMTLQQETGIPIDASMDKVIDELTGRLDMPVIQRHLKILLNNVPYRFLHPWIRTSDDKEMVLRSQQWENGCLYALYKEGTGSYLVLNPEWDSYLHQHYGILIDFAYWNLTQFLQVRNPNVPAISSKLIRPERRNSLSNQHRYWDAVLSTGLSLSCIYTNVPLTRGQYALDHFIPWSFVSHDLLWNLVPANGSVNSSKSDKLPNLQIYLPKLASLHHRALGAYLKLGKSGKVVEDFLSLGYTASELMAMDDPHFLEVYERTFTPLNQIALNMGFETWIQ